MRVRAILKQFCGDQADRNLDFKGFDEEVRKRVRTCIKEGLVELIYRARPRGPMAVRAYLEEGRKALATILPKSNIPEQELDKAANSVWARESEIFTRGIYLQLSNYLMQDTPWDEEQAEKIRQIWRPKVAVPAGPDAPDAPDASNGRAPESLRDMSHSVPPMGGMSALCPTPPLG